MKKTLAIAALLLGLQLAGTGMANAEYDAAGDITVNVNTGLNLPLSSATGETTYETQEGVHNILTDTIGVEVDHSYIWLNVDGVNVLAIDPPRPMF